MNRAKIGILGGTFNPIHVGHLILAQAAVEHFDLDRVMLIPCATPPHKTPTRLAPGEHRLAMIEAAIESNPFFEVSDLELKRSGLSYAVDTVSALTEDRPDSELYFIIGSDMLQQLHEWHNVYDLLSLCRFITFLRPGHGIADLSPADILLDPPWPERLLRDVTSGRQLDISSTDIRYRVAEGLSIRYLVPQEVEIYIAEHGLYQQ